MSFQNPGALGRIHKVLGDDTSDNAFATSNVTSDADGSVLERLEYLQTQIANNVNLYATPSVATGTTDVDVSEADYTTVGGIPVLTITPGSTSLSDVVVDLDLNKDTTGLLVVNTTETIQFCVQAKVDGTNWRTIQHWPAAGPTGLAVADAANDLDAADDSPGHRFHIGPVGADQEVRITLELSAETGGDAEIPYAVYYRGAAPTVTDVAAG